MRDGEMQRSVAVVHLGMLVMLRLNDGRRFYGRVDAVDEQNVYLGRAMPTSAACTPLSWVESMAVITRLPALS
jgi:hypothetical protein